MDESLTKLEDKGAVRILSSTNPFTWIHTAYRIIKDKPDLVIFPWWVIFFAPSYLTIIALLRLFSKSKILFLCHNVLEHESARWKNFIAGWVLRRGDYFICQPGQEKENLRGLLKKEKPILEVHIPNLDVFSSGLISKQDARNKLKIKETKVILFFGFVRPYKGINVLVKAFPKICAAVKDTRLVIAGEFWENPEISLRPLKEARLLERVSVINRYILNEEVPILFSACDVVVLPYTSVTGSGVVQMSFGFCRPVVVTNIGALSSVVKQGETGFLVPPKNADAISDAVIAFFQNPNRERMSENIRNDRQRFLGLS